MNKLFLISWDDDNHSPVYWLNDKLLGVDMDTVTKSIIEYIVTNQIAKVPEIEEIPLNWENVPEEIGDYFQTMPKIDMVDVELINKEDWDNFYEKNIKKIRRRANK